MICRLSGTLSAVDGPPASTAFTAIVEINGNLAYEVLIPAFLAPRLTSKIGQTVTFITIEYLESHNQGASFIPRLIGFSSARERDFFELFTTVKGIGNKRGLRAMAAEPSVIAAAICAKDAKALTKLPEIGKRMAETVIAELHGKADGFLSESEIEQLDRGTSGSAGMAGGISRGPAIEEAISALIALGDTPVEAERRVMIAVSRSSKTGEKTTADEVLAMVYAQR